jgi:hypothetical protein
MVYSFGPADEKLGYTYGHDILDKDIKLSVSGTLKVAVIDKTNDGGTSFDITENKGRAVSVEYFPKKILKNGPVRQIPDMCRVLGFMMVSQKYKDLVEKFEPGVHQFSPVEVYWDKDKPSVGTYYFFNICNRLDTTDKELTTCEWVQGKIAGFWTYGRPGEKWVFRKSSIGNAVIWADKHLSAAPALCTDAFHDATVAAGCDGIDYMHSEEV